LEILKFEKIVKPKLNNSAFCSRDESKRNIPFQQTKRTTKERNEVINEQTNKRTSKLMNKQMKKGTNEQMN
jgi:hypothetical protein